MKVAAPVRRPHEPPQLGRPPASSRAASSTPCPPQPTPADCRTCRPSARPLVTPRSCRADPSHSAEPLAASPPDPARSSGDFQLSPPQILPRSAKLQLNVWSFSVPLPTVFPCNHRAASVPRSHLLVPLQHLAFHSLVSENAGEQVHSAEMWAYERLCLPRCSL